MGRLAAKRVSAPPSSREDFAPTGGRFSPPWAPLLLLLLGIVVLVAPLARGGVWDPYELRVAELSRRLAVGLFHATSLAMAGDPEFLPSLRELGQGELPFTTTALSFALFGLHDWAGRLTSLAFALVTVASLGTLFWRLVERLAAGLAVLVLCTTPLFVWQARAMLGDAATMASLSLATTGFSLACLDPVVTDPLRPARARLASAGWFCLGLIGAGLGILCRGVWIGAAVPALGVSLGCWWGMPSRRLGLSRVVAIVLLAFGVLVGLTGLLVLVGVSPSKEGSVSVLLGGLMLRPASLPTFDALLSQVAHGLFPYSPLLPFAAGHLCFPRRADVDEGGTRRRVVGLVLVLVAWLSYVSVSLAAIRMVPPPYPAVAAVGGVVALSLLSWAKARRVSSTLVMGVTALAILVQADFETVPSRMMVATGQLGATLPQELVAAGLLGMRFATGCILVGASLIVVANVLRYRDAKGPLLERCLGPVNWLRTWHHGLGFHLLVVLETALATLALLVFARRCGLSVSAALPEHGPLLHLVTLGWVVLPVLLLVVPSLLVGTAALLARVRPTTAAARSFWAPLTLCFVAAGLAVSVLQQPALSAGLAPRTPLDRYQKLAAEREPLGLFGVSARSLAYGLRVPVTSFESPNSAVSWLVKDATRRWLLVSRAGFGDLNAAYKERTQSPRSLPVINTQQSELTLVTNRLPEGELSDHPLRDVLVESEPRLRHSLAVVFGGTIRALGWELRDGSGVVTEAVERGETYSLCFGYAVSGPVSGDYQSFVHLEGAGRRYNGDHEIVGGRYPMRLWQRGDWLVDCSELRLDWSYPKGSYALFFGLFRGGRRLEVTAGPSDDNRVSAGSLVVR